MRDLPPASSMRSRGVTLTGYSVFSLVHSRLKSQSSPVPSAVASSMKACDGVLEEELDLLVQVVALEDAAAVAVDGLALAVQHVVVLQHVLALFGVAALDLALGRGDGAGDELGLHRDVVRHGAVHQPLGRAGVEQAHQVVGQRQVEPGLAGVALAAGAAAQLVVDAAGLVPLGAEHVEAAEVEDLLVLVLDGLLGGFEDLRPGGLVLLGVFLRVQSRASRARRRR